jgi:hypothetical protein
VHIEVDGGCGSRRRRRRLRAHCFAHPEATLKPESEVTPIKHLQVAHALRSCHPRFIQVVSIRTCGRAPTIRIGAAFRPKKTEGYTSGVVDVSSTQAPPQLSDVLHALTESQQLLLAKVRALHEEGACRAVHDAPSQAELRRRPGTAFSDSGSALRPREAYGSLRPDMPDVLPDGGHTPDLEVEPEPTGVSPQAITASTEPEIAPEFDARGRNYNFFDELDAKLARMDELGGER